jgi:hypothetical protein
MRGALVIVVALVMVGGAACSRKEESVPAEPASTIAQSTQAAPAAPGDSERIEPPVELPPATLTEVNLVATDVGGGIEELTGGYGPGYMGRRLVDGKKDPPWLVPAAWTWNDRGWAKFPTEVVFSFFGRQSALVGALSIELPDTTTAELPNETSAAPKDIEVWISMTSPTEGFRQVAAATMEPLPGERKIEFPAVEARYVKLRIVSGHSPKELELSEVRVFESVRDGYTPLFERDAEVSRWKDSPRDAAQRGLEWLQQAAVDWGKDAQCVGCHVQAQALMGQAVAIDQGYRVNLRALGELTEQIRSKQLPDGSWPPSPYNTAVAAFSSMGLAQADRVTKKTTDAELLRGADNLLVRQEADGSIPLDSLRPPIEQGNFMTTANSLVALRWAAAHSKDAKYRKAAERALGWIESHEPEMTQDRVFKIIALMHFGSPEQKRIAWSTVESLAAQQQPDGGWKETASMDGSNAFATGQALYAFKQAGMSVQGEMFRRGVDYLMNSQINEPTESNGSWKAVHTQSESKTSFAPTMWAVIGLAASYGEAPMGALQIKKAGDKVAARNLEIVLDVSGSMKAALGETTRWQTALDTLKEVVAALPDDLNVGLRVYGHRYSSKSAQTCQDTELVVPIAPLDRERIVATATALKPRGETPLVRSILKTVGDLKSAGGGSVILITDGEESCKGDAKAAAREIKASGVNVSLNIVGFTLTGKAVEAELAALAGSTRGRYYSAQDGAQLSRAVKLAALSRLPYEVRDGDGKLVASGQTSELSRELPPGNYRIRVDALDQVLEDSLTIVSDQTTTIGLGVEDDRFVLMR